MKSTKNRVISALLAMIMVFLMIPFGTFTIFAADEEVQATTESGVTSEHAKFLGRGYNLLGDATPRKGDLATITGLVFKENSGTSVYDVFFTDETTGGFKTTYEYEFIEDLNTYVSESTSSFSAEIGLSAKIKVVSIEAKVNYGAQTSQKESGSSEYQYAVLSVYKRTAVEQMDLRADNAKRAWTNDLISETFINDIKKLNSEEEFDNFFAHYGTHIITGYSIGGEGIISYRKQNLKSELESSESDTFGGSVSVGANNIGTISGALNRVTGSKDSSGNVTTNNNITFKSYGSTATLSLTNGALDSASITEFIDGIDGISQDIIFDSTFNMLPIWDLLLASGDNDLIIKAAMLKKYYNEKITEQCTSFYSDYLGEVYIPDEDEDSLDWVNIPNLKIISTPEEFYDIRNDLGGTYILACNIDLSGYENWTPIGQSQLKPFTGIIYGNHNTVRGLSINEATSSGEDVPKYYASLFGYSTGTIRDLRVSGTITETASADKYIAGIVADNHGTVKNCYDDVSYVTSYENIADLNIPVKEYYLDEVNASEGRTYTIGDSIGIKLIGSGARTGNINIVVEDTAISTPAYIILENADIVGSSANGTIYNAGTRPVYLISVGTENKVTGSTDAMAINSRNSDVYIFGDAELTVTGGSGKAGGTGSKGSNGAIGFAAQNINILSPLKISFIGGNGGNGGTGSGGGHTYNAGSGGNGGEGGVAIDCQIVSIVNPDANVSIIGGNGGNGGDGGNIPDGSNNSGSYNIADAGNGGNGGNGGVPVLGSSLNSLTCSSLELKHGNGGNGGNGGDGGDPEVFKKNDKADGWSDGGNGGNGGNGFVAGNGGNGGDGGGSYGAEDGAWNKNYISTSGNGGNGGNGGNKIYGVLYASGATQSLITSESCGNAGYAGSCGPVLDAGEDGPDGDEGYDGSNGSAGSYTYGVINKSFVFENHVYQLIEKLSSFEEAKLACEALGGHLVTITSAEENAVVYAVASGNYIFIGCTDEESEGTWVWVNGEEFKYSNWNSGEPNDSYETGEDYTVMLGSTGKWNDTYADGFYYVCEWDSYDAYLESTGTNDEAIIDTPILSGIVTSTADVDPTEINSLNVWNNDLIEIEKIENIDMVNYYSSERFDPDSVKIYWHGTQIGTYTSFLNTFISSDIDERNGYVKITNSTNGTDVYERFIPVKLTRTKATKISIAEIGTPTLFQNSVFSAAGLKINVIYNDGTTELIAHDDARLTYTAPSTAELGTKAVSVHFDASDRDLDDPLTATYNVDIRESTITGIKITSLPDSDARFNQAQGEELNITGLVVKRTMSDGTEEVIDNSALKLEVSPSLCTVGKSTVTILYGLDENGEPYSASYDITVVAKDGFEHAWDKGTVTKEATHIENGEMLYTCTVKNCSASKTEFIPKTEGHSFGKWNAVDSDYHETSCICGEKITAEHEWNEGMETLAPTHTTSGIMTYTCLECSAIRTELIPVTPEHTYSKWTEYDNDTHFKRCECGDTIYEDHIWGTATVTLQPTYTEDGSLYYECSGCNARKTEVIPALGIDKAPQIAVNSIKAKADSEVTVTLEVKNNPGILGAILTLSFDERLTLISSKAGAAWSSLDFTRPGSLTTPCNFIWEGIDENDTSDGVIIELTFRIPADAELEEVYKISASYDDGNIVNSDLEPVDIMMLDGDILVVDYFTADLNDDGAINAQDITLIRRYLAGGYNVEINEKAGDVNKDGVMNIQDIILIRRYLAGGYGVEL